MIYTDLTKLAMKVAFDVHKDQVDISKLPYIYHPIHLAEQMDDEYSVCVALLHDVIEDTDDIIGAINLLEMGFPEEVVNAVDILTHKDYQTYEEYIEAISKNPLARKVKIADLEHNMDITRLPKNFKFRKYKTYKKALKYLCSEN